MAKSIISDGEALEIYRKTLEKKASAKCAAELASASPEEALKVRQRIQEEVNAEFGNYRKKRKSFLGLF